MRSVLTSRVTLEPQTALHAEEMFVLLQDPAIYRYENEPPASVEWLRERFKRLESRQSADRQEAWLNWVLRLPTSELIGYVQATVHSDASAGIAYVLASRFWGQGLAGDAVQAMIDELEQHYKVRTLCAVLKRENLRSIRLLERLRFVRASGNSSALPAMEHDEVCYEKCPTARAA